MIGSGVASVPEQGQTLTAVETTKKISDFVGEDIFVNTNGEVFGTIKKVKNFTEFAKGEKEGYYFPITLGADYTGKEITFKGMETKEKKSNDLNWIVKLSKGKDSTFTFSADEMPDLTLTFKHATLEE